MRYQRGQMQTNLVYSRARKGALPFWVSLNVHTYMSPETGDLEAFTYAYDVTGQNGDGQDHRADLRGAV
jgi:hypothetical protein